MSTDRAPGPAVGSKDWHKALEVRMARPGQAETAARTAIAELAQKLERDLDSQRRADVAKAIMGWAYADDREHVRALLDALPADQVREISAAAALLVSTADAVLKEDLPIE